MGAFNLQREYNELNEWWRKAAGWIGISFLGILITGLFAGQAICHMLH